MGKQILINSSPQETRIALLENNRISELFFERDSDKGIVGNIYKGRVVRVLPGMQAAFVDIGHERAAFLYAGDFLHSKQNTEDFDPDDIDMQNEAGPRRRRSSEEVPPINELVREGQELLVQVAKGPIGTKGARLTCHLSLPGRFLVFMPTLKHNGVSRKIESFDLRKKLKKLIDQFRPKEGGFIVRTAAAGSGMIPEKHIKSDVDYLSGLWQKITRKYTGSPAPKLLHYDLDLTTRTIRDHLDEDIDFLLVDSNQEHKKVLRFIRNFNPELRDKIELYRDSVPLFDRYQVDAEINRALGKRVWLKSGGYLLIEHTEALTSIDVNTGRFVGKKNFEETVVRTNMEAAEEIVRQLRLRNIGGIIIIDFIDMEKDSSKEQVFRYVESLVREDKQKTTILKISNLGLVEMTRKRSREPLHRYHTVGCPTCDGRGFVKNPLALAHQALRDARRELPTLDTDYITITVHPRVYDLLNGQEKSSVINLEKNFQKGIKLAQDPNFHLEQVSISAAGAAAAARGKNLSFPTSMQLQRLETITRAAEFDEEEDDSREYDADVAAIEKVREQQYRSAQEKLKEAGVKAATVGVTPSSLTTTGLDEALPETREDDEGQDEESLSVSEVDTPSEAPLIRESSVSDSDEEDDEEETKN